jgi:hypothetical protein
MNIKMNKQEIIVFSGLFLIVIIAIWSLAHESKKVQLTPTTSPTPSAKVASEELPFYPNQGKE